MKVTKEKFRQCIQRYVFETIAPSMSSLSQFAIGFAYAKMEGELDKHLESFGIIGDDKMVDMEHVERLIQQGFRASQGKVEIPVFGHTITFKPEDWMAFKRGM